MHPDSKARVPMCIGFHATDTLQPGLHPEPRMGNKNKSLLTFMLMKIREKEQVTRKKNRIPSFDFGSATHLYRDH